METYYANNISIPLDIKILFKTVISVVKKGAV
jgi:lipopolysaccharide/colanic/teichoic acid biosynthesis glycosyltransferase